MADPGAAPGLRLTRVRRLAGLAAAAALAASGTYVRIDTVTFPGVPVGYRRYG